MRNVHERVIAAPVEEVGALLAGVGRPDDRLWPGHDWMPMTLDRPVGVGARGGHADIRYSVTAYQPGRRVVFAFEPPTLLTGWHALEVEPGPDGSTLVRHVLEAQPHGSFRLLLPLVVRWVHDAVVEDLLDRAEVAVGRVPTQPATWSAWVRLLRRLNGMSPHRTGVRTAGVTAAMTAAADLPGADFQDAFAVRLPPGSSPAVRGYYESLVSASTPRWMSALVRVRRILARAMGLRTADWQAGTSPFVLLRATDERVVAGADDRHLDFRAVLELQDEPGTGPELVLATFVQRHNLAGRAYFMLVLPFHRLIVPAMLRRMAAQVPLEPTLEGTIVPVPRDAARRREQPSVSADELACWSASAVRQVSRWS